MNLVAKCDLCNKESILVDGCEWSGRAWCYSCANKWDQDNPKSITTILANEEQRVFATTSKGKRRHSRGKEAEMKYVAKCQDCGEQKILEEWMRCKSCFVKWFSDALSKSDYLTDDDAWYVIPQLDPAKVDEAVAACGAAKDAAERAEAFNLAKADAAVARMKNLEPPVFHPKPDDRVRITSRPASPIPREGLPSTSLEAAHQVNILISDRIEKMKPVADKAWAKCLRTWNLHRNFS